MNDLSRLAELLRARNTVEGNIANMLGRTVNVGTLGEHIASRVFDITLVQSSQHKEFAGIFTHPPLQGKTVDIQWHIRREGDINLHADPPPDYYLVLAGPKQESSTTRSIVNPWIIRSVYLFDAGELLTALRERGVQISAHSSVINELWERSEIYPVQRNSELILNEEQRRLLALFGG